MNDKIICHGCGLELQFEDENQPGYAPKEALERTAPLCKRCFRLQNYGEFKHGEMQNEKFLEIIKKSNDEDCLVIYVIDIFNFYGSIIKNLAKIIQNPILIVINKIDLLPKSVKIENVLRWVEDKLYRLGIRYLDIEVVSANKKFNIDSLFEKINLYSNKRSVYIIGNANVGKSAIINAILKSYSNNTKELISSSVFPGTTLKTIKIPFDDGCFLYDTPGLIDQGSILNHVNEKSIKALIPLKEIKPLSYPLLLKQTFFIGAIARIDFKGEIGSTMIIYTSEKINITRSTLLSLDAKSDARFDKLVNEGKVLPQANLPLVFSDLQKHEINFDRRMRKSIFINGLGFIDIISNSAAVDIYVPKGVEIIVDDPIIGGKNNVK